MMSNYPNILWLMTDEHRTDSLGCYNSSWAASPNLDRLAERGTRFQTAATPSPVCVAARTSIFSGLYPHNTGIWFNIPRNSGPGFSMLTDIFHQAGYASASFGKQHYVNDRNVFQTETALSEGVQAVSPFEYRPPYNGRDFKMLQHPGPNPWILGGRYPEDPASKSETRAVDACINWLSAKKNENSPFLLRCSFAGPHTPVVPPAPYDSMISPDDINIPGETETMPEDAPQWIRHDQAVQRDGTCFSSGQVRQLRSHYYGFSAFIDAQFGRLLDWMNARGLLENTIVAFTADHGTLLCDYGMVQKGSFYEPDVNVPLILAGPGIKEDTVLSTPVTTLSLLPTLLELAGLDVPDACEAPSLAPALQSGSEPLCEPILSEISERYPHKLTGLSEPLEGVRLGLRRAMLRMGDWKYCCCLDPDPIEPTLHNLKDDPFERRNLSGSSETADLERNMARQLTETVGDKPVFGLELTRAEH